MTSMKKKKKILFWKHMINRVFSRDFCSGMVLFYIAFWILFVTGKGSPDGDGQFHKETLGDVM